MKGQKKKALWAKRRAANAATRAAEKEANVQRKYKPSKEFVQLKARKYHEVFDPRSLEVQKLPSLPLSMPGLERKELDERMLFDPEWQAREKAAQEEKARKGKQLAPMYNKGPVQYVGGIEDKQVIRDLGKKV